MGFSSAQSGWSFTLRSFAKLYCEVYGVAMDAEEFARRLWGDVYYHADTRTFRKKAPERGGERSFVQFILDPLYKIYAQARLDALCIGSLHIPSLLPRPLCVGGTTEGATAMSLLDAFKSVVLHFAAACMHAGLIIQQCSGCDGFI